MARLWTEGWEMQDVLGYTNYGSATYATTKRSGNASLRCNNSTYYTDKIFSTGMSEAYLRVGVYSNGSSFPRINWYSGSTLLGYVAWDSSTSKAKIYTGSSTLVATGTRTLSPSNWYLFEIHIKIADSPDGVLELKIDGQTEATFTGGDTKPDANTTFDKIRLDANSSSDVLFDDCALNDTTGGADNSWCGDGSILALFPDATEAQGLLGSDGDTVNNHLLVDEKPADGDTTYVYGTTADLQDLYSFPACGLSNVTFYRVWAEARARETVASAGKIALVIKSGATSDASADLEIIDAYSMKTIGDILTLNPDDSAAWEVADIDAIQAGPRIR